MAGYRLAAGALIAAYVACAVPGEAGRWLDRVWLPATRFGVDQLQPFGWVAVAALLAAAISAAPLARSRGAAHLLKIVTQLSGRPSGRLLLAGSAALLFWMLRSHTLNPDGAAFQDKFDRDVPVNGVFVTHDEILEFVVHSRFWAFTHAWWGWDVPTSYQVLSSVAGGVFVALVARYAHLVHPIHAGALVLLTMTGGFVQLFFGDVENYTLTAVVILGYFLAAERFLQRRASIVWPSAWLATAMMCHLLAGFLLPSLLYLWRVANRRRAGRQVGAGLLVLLGIITVTLLACHIVWGLPIERLLESHAGGHGGRYRDVLARPTLTHYWAQLNVLLLLCPGVVLALPLAIAPGLARTERDVHLAIAAAAMLTFLLVWFPALGPREDWNLFANVAIPVSLLVWSSALSAPGLAERRAILTGVGLVGGLHSLAWVWRNHVGG